MRGSGVRYSASMRNGPKVVSAVQFPKLTRRALGKQRYRTVQGETGGFPRCECVNNV